MNALVSSGVPNQQGNQLLRTLVDFLCEFRVGCASHSSAVCGGYGSACGRERLCLKYTGHLRVCVRQERVQCPW
jgi:hypothetical protein